MWLNRLNLSIQNNLNLFIFVSNQYIFLSKCLGGNTVYYQIMNNSFFVSDGARYWYAFFLYFQEGYQDLATSQHLDTHFFYIFRRGIKILRRRNILIRVFSIFSEGVSRSCDVARYWYAFFLYFQKGYQDLATSQHLDMRHKTYLLCFLSLSAPYIGMLK